MSEEGCHCLDAGFSPDALILDVVLLGLAYFPSRHYHLSGVEFLCIFSLGSTSFRQVCHCLLDYASVDIIFHIGR